MSVDMQSGQTGVYQESKAGESLAGLYVTLVAIGCLWVGGILVIALF
jgi:hypothetical protein